MEWYFVALMAIWLVSFIRVSQRLKVDNACFNTTKGTEFEEISRSGKLLSILAKEALGTRTRLLKQDTPAKDFVINFSKVQFKEQYDQGINMVLGLKIIWD